MYVVRHTPFWYIRGVGGMMKKFLIMFLILVTTIIVSYNIIFYPSQPFCAEIWDNNYEGQRWPMLNYLLEQYEIIGMSEYEVIEFWHYFTFAPHSWQPFKINVYSRQTT